MPGFVHQVEMKLSVEETPERLRRIESWCADWQIGFRVLDRFSGSENIRLAFEDVRQARAFVSHFGGVMIDDREVAVAFASEIADEDAYDRLAHEYPD